MRIVINGVNTQIGSPIPDVITGLHVEFVSHPMMPQQVPKAHIPLIKKWFNDVIDACECTWITYNDVFMLKEDCRKFEDI